MVFVKNPLRVLLINKRLLKNLGGGVINHALTVDPESKRPRVTYESNECPQIETNVVYYGR